MKYKKKRSMHKLRIQFKATRRKASKVAKTLVVVLIPALLLIFLYQLLVQSEIFKIKNVDVLGATAFVNFTDVKKITEQQTLNKNIFTVDIALVEKNLSDTFLGAKEIAAKRDFPDKVVVKVTERTPLAIVTGDDKAQKYMVDNEGYILGLVDASHKNLPQVDYSGTLHVGTFIDKKLVPLYLDLLNALDEQKLNASSVSVHETFMDFYLKDNVNVLLNTDEDISKNVTVMSTLLKQLGIEGKTVKKIDLRYDKVIVEY